MNIIDNDLIFYQQLVNIIWTSSAVFMGFYFLYHIKYTKELSVRIIICLCSLGYFFMGALF